VQEIINRQILGLLLTFSSLFPPAHRAREQDTPKRTEGHNTPICVSGIHGKSKLTGPVMIGSACATSKLPERSEFNSSPWLELPRCRLLCRPNHLLLATASPARSVY